MSNCIVAQSGGPTSVINSSVAGLVNANIEKNIFEKVYAGLNGVEGILNEDIIDLSSISKEDIDTFKFTPSSGLGSCRYKLKNIEESDEEYKKLINILRKYDITSFFYIGGNDSMDTIAKLSKYASEKNIHINFIGIPKTIDNDLMYTDHTPGFSSAAKFIATSTLETYLDASVYINNGIFILETMGRDAGWLAASACIAKINNKKVADFIYLPEAVFDKDKFISDVKEKFEKQNKVYIVASEGIKYKNSHFVSETECTSHDKFGHIQLGGVGNYLKTLILESEITSRVKVLELGILQRCSMHSASLTDINESFDAGYNALLAANNNESGKMVSIVRESENPYKASYSLIDADKVANKIRYFPKEWINKDQNNISKEAEDYFIPLIKGNVNAKLNNEGLPKYKVFHNR
ncbi:6-phosphofructokinase [Clostridium sp. BJN0001]|uniref:6-phosphofructokinase n=1 Tax=Clostridium sp. BJN0001 TaxID=2930219 RepID=UPI001FD2D9CB|nr:6-phosphofructokinase [Clostridium sp. BJN0001]